MITVEKALETILGAVGPLPSEKVNLAEALDRVSAADISSKADIPSLDNSAMDGYAVRASDISDASKGSPIILDVIEEVRAGFIASSSVKEGQAIKIMTGAPTPGGADSVVMVEDTERKDPDGQVSIFRGTKPGENIRKRAEDIREGETIITRGTFLTPASLGIIAASGVSEVEVFKRPEVAVLATGDEVIDVGEKLSPGKLYSSNTYALMAQVVKCGGIPIGLGISKDDPKELEEKIKSGLGCDIIVTSGGVSAGDYDFVKQALSSLGAELAFDKVAVKPGKPVVFGVINGKPVFGLPGNPVSSMISFELFVQPAIFKMLGRSDDVKGKEVSAVLEEDIKKKKGRRHFLRAITRWENGDYITRTTGPQGSGILKSMALADSLIVFSEDDEFVKKGTRVTVRFL